MILSSRRFKLLFVAAVAWMMVPQLARADYMVTATIKGVDKPNTIGLSPNSGSSWENVLAGGYLWKNATGTGTQFIGSDFQTFCIEVRQNIALNGTYSFKLSTDLEHLPKKSMGEGMGAAKAQQVAYLVDAYKNNIFTESVATPSAIQAAIWNLINDTDYNTKAGIFRAKDGSSSSAFEDSVNAIMANVKDNFSGFDVNSAKWNVIGLTNDTFQDQIVIVDHDTFLAFSAPAPAGIVLAGIGFVALGAYGLRKRRGAPAVV